MRISDWSSDVCSSDLRDGEGALSAPLLFVLGIVDPHNDAPVERQRVQIEREALSVAGCPCNADVCPSGVVAFAVHREEAMAGAVLISVGHDVLLPVCRRIIPMVPWVRGGGTTKPG